MSNDLDLASVDDILTSVDNDIAVFEKSLHELRTRREQDTITKYLTDAGFTRTAKGPASGKFTLILHNVQDEALRMLIHKKTKVIETKKDKDILDKTIKNSIIVTTNKKSFESLKSRAKKVCPKIPLYKTMVVLINKRKIMDYIGFDKKAPPNENDKIVTADAKTLRIRFPFKLTLSDRLPRRKSEIDALPIDVIATITLLTTSRVYASHSRYNNVFQLGKLCKIPPMDGTSNYGLPEKVDEIVNEESIAELNEDESAGQKKTREKLAACYADILAYEFEIQLDVFEGSVFRARLLLNTLEAEGFTISESVKHSILRKIRNTKYWMTPPPIDVYKDTLFRTHLGKIEQINKIHKLNLQWHQKYSIAMCMRKKAMILQCDVGLGKSRIAIGLHHALSVKRTLICVEPGNIGEFQREMKKIGMVAPFVIKKASDIPLTRENATDITIIGYSILGTETKKVTGEKANKKGLYSIHTTGDDLRGFFDLVIFDECFTYNTKVMTDEGPQKIGDLVTQRSNNLVLSKDLDTGEWQYKPIVHYFQKPYVDSTIKIEYNNGHSVTCTPDHKIWTKEKGYVKAKELRNETVCFMWEEVHILPTKVNATKEKLQLKVCGNITMHNKNKNLRVAWENIQPRSRKDEKEQEDTLLRKAMFCKMEKQSTKSTRKISQDTKEIRRSSNSRQEDSDRSRRRISQDQEVEIPRQEERIRIGYAQVESVTILEQGNPRGSGNSTHKDRRVFNIDVGDNHNYVANGLLVKNCQNVKSPSSLKAKSAMRLRPKKSVFMSGTVVTNKMAELATYAIIGYGSKSCISKVDATPLQHNSMEIKRKNKRILAPFGTGHKILHNISVDNLRLASIGEKMTSDPEFTKDYVRNLVIKVARENVDLVKSDMFRFNVKEMKVVAVPTIEQFEQYLTILDGSRAFVNSEQRSLSRLISMMKISECPKLLYPSWDGVPTAKQLATRDLVTEKISEQRSVLIFTGFTEAAKDMNRMIRETGTECFLLTSEMTPTARYKVIEKFRATPNSVAVGNIGIMGKGFNLENADVVVMSDVPWSPAYYEQAIGRILRPDQTGSPEVYVIFNQYMIDQYKFEVISSKRRTIDKYLRDKDISYEETKHISYTEFLEMVIKKADQRGETG